jgi:two-component system, OmpR family, alkaline phosphatase synthesis response regulator PhoP
MSEKKIKILVVDDEQDITDFITYNLQREGFEVKAAKNGKEAIETARQYQPNLILLDIMMPGMDGIETCREMRRDKTLQETLIVFLTARDEDFIQVSALDVGGDDFINKSVRPRVLVSRLHALLRRTGRVNAAIEEENNAILYFGNIAIDKERLTVRQNGGDEISFAKKEFELLLLLSSRPGKVFNREEIFNKIWGTEVFTGERTIDVHIRKLREKLGDDTIKTVKGVGYKFEMTIF